MLCPHIVGNLISYRYTPRPDETNDISTLSSFPPTGLPSGIPKALILDTGLSEGISNILNKLKEPYNLSNLESLPNVINNYPILIIPSAGLYGIEKSIFFKSLLSNYVENGGTIICFTQQRGYEFSSLPGGRLSGYGWIEDQACHNNAAYIDNYHSVFSGQSKTNLDCNVDGFFTQYPDNAKILLKRVKNQYPAVVMYSYGSGTVIASTLYSDWAYEDNQWTQDEMDLIRDMLSWAKNPVQEIPEYIQGDAITMPVEIGYIGTGALASKAILTVYNPNKDAISSQTIACSLSHQGTATVLFNYTAPSILGIYWVNYTLLDANDNIVQEEFGGARFAVATTLVGTKPQKEITLSVTSTEESYPNNSKGIFKATVYNDRLTETELLLKCYTYSHTPYYWNPQTATVKVQSKDSSVVSFEVDNIHTDDQFVCELYENGEKIVSGFIQFCVFSPFVNANVTTDKKMYGKAEEVNINLKLQNTQSINLDDLEIRVNVLDPNNVRIFGTISQASLSSFGSINIPYKFILPDILSGGVYIVAMDVFFFGSRIGMASAGFELPKALLGITPILPNTFIPNTDNSVSFQIKNIGFVDTSRGTLTVNFESFNQEIVSTQTTAFGTITIGQTQTLVFNIPIPQIKLGVVYALSYILVYEDKTIKGRIEIPASNIITIDVDKPASGILNPE